MAILSVRQWSTPQCDHLLSRLRCLNQTIRDAGLKLWLQRELEGYDPLSSLPWYRVLECRQRGLFRDRRTGRQHTSHINEGAIAQRDLGAVRFLLLRSPLASYLHGHPLELERWPAALLDQYHAQLIPEMTCLCAWKEPLLPVRETLIRGVDHVLDEYAPTLSHQLVECHRSLRAIQHRHWQI